MNGLKWSNSLKIKSWDEIKLDERIDEQAHFKELGLWKSKPGSPLAGIEEISDLLLGR